MRKKGENPGYIELHGYDDSHEGDFSHKELQNIDFTPKTKLRKAVEYTVRGISDFMRAMDDIFGYYSSIATLGFVIVMAPFLVIAALLSIAYFIVKQRKINREEANYGKDTLAAMAENIITDDHYHEWKNLLTMSDEGEFAEIFEEFIRDRDAEEIHEELKKCIANIKKNLHQYDGNPEKIELIQMQLEILDSSVPNEQPPAPVLNSPFDYIKHYAKQAWNWLVDNYKNILTGVTIAATFCTLGVILFGAGILTLFPVNIIVALIVVGAVVAGNWAYKTYFKKKFQKMMGTYHNAKKALTEKKEQADLLIRAKQINFQLNSQINNPNAKVNNYNDNNLAINVNDFDLEHDNANAPEEKFELVEVQQLRAKPTRLRYVANYILPSLLAINAGYGIGATLLQLTIISGLSAPILPFIIVGMVFASIYVIHRIYQSAKENNQEKVQIKNLDTDIIDNKKIELYEHRYKLATNQNKIDKNGEAVCLQQYIAECTADQIADDLIKAYLGRAVSKNLIAAQVSTLHSADLKTKLMNSFALEDIKLPEEDNLDDDKLPNTLKTLAARYIKPFAKGAGFGLSIAASLIIFLVGASTFVSIPLSITILVVGAVVGLAISLLDKVANTYRKDFQETIKQTVHAVEDKDQLMEMLVESFEMNNSVVEIKEPIKVHALPSLTPKREDTFAKQRRQSVGSLAELTAKQRGKLLQTFENSKNSVPAEGAGLTPPSL